MLTKPSGVLVCVHASSADHGYYTRSGQFNKYVIGICCFSAEHTTLSSKRKDIDVLGSVYMYMYIGNMSE